MKVLQAIKWSRDPQCIDEKKASSASSSGSSSSSSPARLWILDQTQIPWQEEWTPVTSAQDAHDVIRAMLVRGAPAIGVTAALGLATELLDAKASGRFSTVDDVKTFVREATQLLERSRPTAVNLFDATARLRRASENAAAKEKSNGDAVIDACVSCAEEYFEDDVRTNRALGEHGARFLLDRIVTTGDDKEDEDARFAKKDKMCIMTHCNTGSLATAGYGTALGIVRSVAAAGKLRECVATETRPYNQGARLTCFELAHDGLPSRLIADSMAPALMRLGEGDAVVVGADRVAANGDTANKIGTYALAIAAKHHGVPFVIAAPSSSVDLAIAEGSAIPIEERSHDELTHSPRWMGSDPRRVVVNGIGCWNPAFDVAPATLITAIVTEKGIVLPDEQGAFDMRAHLTTTEGDGATGALMTKAQPQPNYGFFELGGSDNDSTNISRVGTYVSSVPKLAYILGGEPSDWTADEVGDGNINFVYIVRGPKASIVLKQALPYVRCVGTEWPLPVSRLNFERLALEYARTCGCAELAPEVYHFDAQMSVLAMEYVPPPAHVLRGGLIAGHVYPGLGAKVARFCAATLFRSSLLCVSATRLREQAGLFAGNKAMCELTERVIFTDPYVYKAEGNRWTSPQLDDVVLELSRDNELKAHVCALKRAFCERQQALLHGDLHTGSVMANEEGLVKVIDPEFAFYGPMGFDVGAFIANLLLNYFSTDGRKGSSFALVRSPMSTPEQSSATTAEEKENAANGDNAKPQAVDFRKWVLNEAGVFWEKFQEEFMSMWEEEGRCSGGLTAKFSGDANDDALDASGVRATYMRELFADTLGFAGCKMIRRVVGIAHVEDLEMIEDKDTRAACERRCIAMGRMLILKRNKYSSIDEVLEDARLLRTGEAFFVGSATPANAA